MNLAHTLTHTAIRTGISFFEARDVSDQLSNASTLILLHITKTCRNIHCLEPFRFKAKKSPPLVSVAPDNPASYTRDPSLGKNEQSILRRCHETQMFHPEVSPKLFPGTLTPATPIPNLFIPFPMFWSKSRLLPKSREGKWGPAWHEETEAR